MKRHAQGYFNQMKTPAPSASRKARRISVSLAEREHAILTEMAERHDVSISWFARKAIAEFIDKYNGVETQLPLVLGR